MNMENACHSPSLRSPPTPTTRPSSPACAPSAGASALAAPKALEPSEASGFASWSRSTTATTDGAPRRWATKTPTVAEELQAIAGVILVTLLVGAAAIAWVAPEPTTVDDLFQPRAVEATP